MFLFDCNVSFGVAPKPALSYAATAEALLAEMDRNGVDEALVVCAAQRFDSPLVGNPLLIEQTGGRPRLHPAWAILPAQTGEMEVETLLAAMRAHAVRALWAWPAQHHYLLDALTMGPLLEELVARRIPLFVPLTEYGGRAAGWVAVGNLLRDYPELVLVATDQSVWGEDRYFRPLLARYPNLHLETSHYELAHGLRDVVATYGAERWLFGSGYPTRTMGGAAMQLLHADIPPAAAEAIAGGNLRRLLKEVRL
ncbi:MAG: amidohydrolase family protein [Anaerolineae bacterium]|nr:amidohydrolase family protein [Anaerolineae bacterium]